MQININWLFEIEIELSRSFLQMRAYVQSTWFAISHTDSDENVQRHKESATRFANLFKMNKYTHVKIEYGDVDYRIHSYMHFRQYLIGRPIHTIIIKIDGTFQWTQWYFTEIDSFI